jgi:hypothetical protein
VYVIPIGAGKVIGDKVIRGFFLLPLEEKSSLYSLILSR